MKISQKIEENLKEALKAKKMEIVTTLRGLKSSLHNKEIELRKKELINEEEIQVLSSEAKQRRDSISEFEKGNRQDLADKEKEELKIIEEYLPETMSEEDIISIVEETIKETGAESPADMGRVMGAAMAKLKGQADGNTVSRIVKEKLSG